MRGVVSLAAALSVPIYLSDGTAFPQRNLILFITFTVILITLVVQGLTLPLLIKWVKMEDPDRKMSDEEQELLIRRKLSERSLELLDGEHKQIVRTNSSLQNLREKFKTDQSHIIDSDTMADKEFKNIYLQLLAQQRRLLLQLNKSADTDEDIVRKYQGILDLEEEKLRSRFD